VTSGNVSNGVRHGEHGESKGQGNTHKSDAEAGKSGGQNGAAAASKHQPKRSHKFRDRSLREWHYFVPPTSEFACCGSMSEPHGLLRYHNQMPMAAAIVLLTHDFEHLDAARGGRVAKLAIKFLNLRRVAQRARPSEPPFFFSRAMENTRRASLH
jgi:hypothetical protein